MICVENISKTYYPATLANKNISFSVDLGDMVWIRGRSGSGKTTLMNILTALDKPDAGEIQFFERDFRALNDSQKTILRRDRMGLMFQHFELLPMLNGYENIRVPVMLGRNLPNGMAEAKPDLRTKFCQSVDDIVRQIRPDLDFLQKKIPQMSGGQRQIINIVRALIYVPLLLIGDEITSNLDVESSRNIYQLLRDTIQQNQSVGIFISHDQVIGEYCNRIFTMEDGVLEEK